MSKILIIEPFYGGSHKKLIDTITLNMNPNDYTLITMTAKKWHWRARSSSLYISQQIPDLKDFKILFCSSVLSLAELIGMYPSLSSLKKVVYFHENQIVYPKQTIKDRDFQYGFNQITTCLAADQIVFNSLYNMNSFLDNIDKFIKIMPDYKVKNIVSLIKPKSSVLYFPINFSIIDGVKKKSRKVTSINDVVHIVWPHRWEYDKNPELFFHTLYRLKDENVKFKVSVLGEAFSEIPDIFLEAHEALKNYIHHFGFVQSTENFYSILIDADIVVSTAEHEFFGVSMLEAVKCGCFPLAPNKLVYPEIYPKECLFKSNDELFAKLKSWCSSPNKLKDLKNRLNIDIERFDTKVLLPKYLSILS